MMTEKSWVHIQKVTLAVEMNIYCFWEKFFVLRIKDNQISLIAAFCLLFLSLLV